MDRIAERYRQERRERIERCIAAAKAGDRPAFEREWSAMGPNDRMVVEGAARAHEIGESMKGWR